MNSENLMAASYAVSVENPRAPYFISLREKARRIAMNIVTLPDSLREWTGLAGAIGSDAP
jgi:hypothetical protein